MTPEEQLAKRRCQVRALRAWAHCRAVALGLAPLVGLLMVAFGLGAGIQPPAEVRASGLSAAFLLAPDTIRVPALPAPAAPSVPQPAPETLPPPDSTVVPVETAPETSPDAVPVEALAEAAVVEELGTGEASYYGEELAGNRTASGERFDPSKLTAAHRTLPLGSVVRVTNLRNGKSVVVRINDRGPFHGRRVIDLSKGAARLIGMVRSGTAHVRMELMQHGALAAGRRP